MLTKLAVLSAKATFCRGVLITAGMLHFHALEASHVTSKLFHFVMSSPGTNLSIFDKKIHHTPVLHLSDTVHEGQVQWLHVLSGVWQSV